MAKLKSFSLSAVSSSLEAFQMLEDTNYKILGSLSEQNSCHCLKVLDDHMDSRHTKKDESWLRYNSSARTLKEKSSSICDSSE